MNNIVKVGRRNNIEILGRRYSLSSLISESYQTLYDCKLDSKLYKLTESHINSIKSNPENISLHSKNLEILKGLVKLGESAKIEESDIPVVEEIEDEDVIKEDADLEVESDTDVINEDADMEELEDKDVINEDSDLEELEDEDVINEDSDMEELEDKDVINEDADMEELEGEDVINEEEEISPDDESDEITPEELVELKKHLKEIRKNRRARESTEPDLNDPEIDECPDRLKKTGRFPESRSWKSEKSSMTKALKNFRESSSKKAFYKSFKRLHDSMKSSKNFTLEESILLYKASNSAMTHLTVELEHNPEFIYTFRECTSLLSKDNEKLLECIRSQVSPDESLLESYRNFSSILLESEDFDDEITDEEEDLLGTEEEAINASEEIPAEEEVIQEEEETDEEIPEPEEEVVESEEEIPSEVIEEPETVIPAEEEVIQEEEIPTEEEVPAPESEEIPAEVDSEDILEEEEDLDTEITDEEAEELRNKLMELRKSRKK